VPDRNGKIFYTSITSLSHISKGGGDVVAKTRLAAEELYKLKRAAKARG